MTILLIATKWKERGEVHNWKAKCDSRISLVSTRIARPFWRTSFHLTSSERILRIYIVFWRTRDVQARSTPCPARLCCDRRLSKASTCTCLYIEDRLRIQVLTLMLLSDTSSCEFSSLLTFDGYLHTSSWTIFLRHGFYIPM